MSEASPNPDLAEALRLRPDPKPVLRLSRKALTVMGIVAGAGIGGALMLALAPPAKPIVPRPEVSAPEKRPRSNETLNRLPASYADVPVLGPPLPGDLGKPMLNSGLVATGDSGEQNAVSDQGVLRSSEPPSAPPGPDDQTRLNARSSSVFAPGNAPKAQVEPSPLPLPPLPDLVRLMAPQQELQRNAVDEQTAFIRADTDRSIVSEERLIMPASPYLIQAGSVLPAALVTGIRSDLPGQVVAQVTQDVYDTLGQGHLLIPQGSRLLGEYDNAIAFGQSRVLLAWRRLILPNGKSLILERLSAADVSGQAGLEDRTDYHFDGLLAAGALSTVLSVGAQAGSSDSDSDIVRAIREGAGDSISRTGQRIVERQLNITPTLTIRPGHRVRVILSKDLVLEPYGG
jgi:type IV secretion system protein VirB10